MSDVKQLTSYVAGAWTPGTSAGATLHNPTTGKALATASTEGIDFAATVAFARDKGVPALAEMTFAQRGQILAGLADALHKHRDELLALETANGGATRGDGKFDLDGGIGALAHYAELGKGLGEVRLLKDGDSEKLGRGARWVGQHFHGPRRGVAVHINAFNFPIWGMAEKMAMAILGGMPVVTKPATSTAMIAHRAAEILVESKLLPDGAFSFVAGSVGDLLNHLQYQDVVSFTGSSATAGKIRSNQNLLDNNVAIAVEADSLNSVVLGPGVDPSDETYDAFLRDVVREMTQKTGQKCTAIRRILVPKSSVDQVVEDLKENLANITVGDPTQGRAVQMGPVTSKSQLEDIGAGLAQLQEVADLAYGDGGRGELAGVDSAGYFMGPVLLVAKSSDAKSPVHKVEVFGPVATVVPYDGTAADACRIAAYAGGALVTSIYTDDRDFGTSLATMAAPSHGRIFVYNEKAAAMMGPGAVFPQLMHGGPGRAGGGVELGGLRGLMFYLQPFVVQGDAPWLEGMS